MDGVRAFWNGKKLLSRHGKEINCPAWFLEGCAAKESVAATGEKPRIALVGCGGMGRHDAKLAAKFGTISVICDVDEAHLADTKSKDWPDAALETDFRKVMERKIEELAKNEKEWEKA